MEFIDTHTHPYSEEFDEDRDAVVQRALQAGVAAMFLPAIDKGSYPRQEALVQAYPHVFFQMMGLHPTSVDEHWEEALLLAYTTLLACPGKYIGIGEIGLDFYWDQTFRPQQEVVLRQQLQWAAEWSKPVSVHLRSAKDGTADAVDAFFDIWNEGRRNANPGILHCFSGTVEQALQAIDMGFLLGIGGVATYKKNSLAEVVKSVPLESLVLETDAPYLSPAPYRGKRNESSYLPIVAQKVADLKSVSLLTVADVTSCNARRWLER